MPELPEVQTIVSDLNRELTGARILAVNVAAPKMAVPNVRVLNLAAVGAEIVGVKRVAKSVVVELSRREAKSYLVFYLRMTGRLLLRPKGYKEDDWVRLIFHLERKDGESGREKQFLELRFAEARRFGFVEVMDEARMSVHRGRYGPDALDPGLSPLLFLRRLQGKKTNVKQALLEQNLIAGVGNIYANDSLWMSGIHPQTLSTQVTMAQGQKLLEALRLILKEGIEHRGSTLDDGMYVDIFGREGTHQNHFHVFGKNGEPCPRCGTKIEVTEIGGRGTFFCPKCQKKAQETRAEGTRGEGEARRRVQVGGDQIKLI